MAMSRGCGIDEPGAQLVTVDKVDMAGPGLAGIPQVRRIHGDSTSETTFRGVREHLDGPIDLFYIDSKHDYEHTAANLCIYGQALDPRFVILDDIHLNAEMERIWAELLELHGARAFDASDLVMRPSGFGVIDFR